MPSTPRPTKTLMPPAIASPTSRELMEGGRTHASGLAKVESSSPDKPHEMWPSLLSVGGHYIGKAHPAFAPESAGRAGRPEVAPERLLKAMLLMAFYSIRSERQHNLLNRLFRRPVRAAATSSSAWLFHRCRTDRRRCGRYHASAPAPPPAAPPSPPPRARLFSALP
jgi:hypothetical protein